MNVHRKAIQISTDVEPNPVLVNGDGEPVIYLHGLLGQEWDGFLTDIAGHRRVYAPAHVGSDEADELKNFDGIHDLILYYDELFDRLGLQQFDLIGHSFGGMVAAEYAATFSHRVRRLVLIDPLGLWRDDAPVQDYLLIPPEKQAAMLVGSPSNEEVRLKMTLPEDPKQQISEMLQRMMSLASTSHFIWPIPERGLIRRLYRIKAKTLILWGKNDQFVPAIYAQDFAAKISASQIELISDAGHSPQIEQRHSVAEKILKFLT